MTLLDFLRTNETEILASIDEKSSALGVVRSGSEQQQRGLPVFFRQLMEVLANILAEPVAPAIDRDELVKAANASDEPAIARAVGRPYDVEVAKSAGEYGKELQQLGYTLSHVVHGYGAICQAITEIAIVKKEPIKTEEFRVLNRCLDTAIAGAVTVFHAERAQSDDARETAHLGFLAHELRNAQAIVSTSLRLIKSGTVGFGGSIGQVLDRAMKRQQELIDRSLAEVRLRVDPKVHKETASFLQHLDQLLVTADAETRARNQLLKIEVDAGLEVEADQYLLFSAVSNLVQNAIKYTCHGGTICIRAHIVDDQTLIEVEDECGGLGLATPSNLFKPFEQHNKNREGLGLGLSIAERAVALNGGTIDVRDYPGRGCVFRITLPGAIRKPMADAARAAAGTRIVAHIADLRPAAVSGKSAAADL